MRQLNAGGVAYLQKAQSSAHKHRQGTRRRLGFELRKVCWVAVLNNDQYIFKFVQRVVNCT